MNLTVIAAGVMGAFVAYTNGANNVSKWIATVASTVGVTSYRRKSSGALSGQRAAALPPSRLLAP
jgi:hypothetical protein